jgi:tripeptide aminopeptidase
VSTKARKSYRGYRFKRDDDVVKLAATALERCGYEVTYALSGGAADANVFNEHGRRCVNLANGMTDIHTSDERISVQDLDGMVEVTLALVDAARGA